MDAKAPTEGKAEALGRREKIIGGLNLKRMDGIEIGPLCRPVVTKEESRVIYVDHADADELRNKYATQPTVDITQIVDVDAVWGGATLRQAIGHGFNVDYVVASHVIEHVPDLIGWLEELSSVLRDGGEVRLAVPDKRFTFDYLRRESQFADALNAYLLRSRRPSCYFLLDHFLNFRIVDSVKAWTGSLEVCSEPSDTAFRDTMRVARQAMEGVYCDAHCWVFTPRSFAGLFKVASRFGLIDFACQNFYDTAPNEIEFFVHLLKCDDRSKIFDSWQHMADTARDCPLRSVGDFEETEVDRLRAQLSDTERRERQLAEQLRETRNHVSALQSSNSWKVTRPLRVICKALRGYRAR